LTDNQPITADDLYALQFVGDPRVSPDGTRVAFVITVADKERNDYRSRIWLAPTDGSAPPRPLTAGAGKDTGPRWSPDGRRIAFLSDRELPTLPPGVERGQKTKAQIWVLDLAGGEARQVTALKQGAGDPAWSPDGTQLTFTSQTGGPDDEPLDTSKSAAERASERADRVREITTLKYKFDGLGYLHNKRRHLFITALPAPGAPPTAARQLTHGLPNDGQPTWSPDGTRLAFVSYREPDEDVTFRTDIWTLTLADGACHKLTGSGGTSTAPQWSPDGTQIAYLGHQECEGEAAMTRLWTVAANGESAPVCRSAAFDRDLGNSTLTDQTLPGGHEGPVWSPDGRTLLALVSDGGTTSLRRFGLDGTAPEVVLGGERVVTAFATSADGARLVFAATTPTTPAELFTLNSDGTEKPLTTANAALLRGRTVAAPKPFRYPGANGDMIDGWLLEPPGATPGAALPLIVEIHGGPHAQYGAAFFHEFQTLVGRGYAIFYCNPHGGTGRGDAFAKAILRDWGVIAMDDVMAGLDVALTRGSFDAARLGVTGGSYGGFLTNWITSHSTRFAAAVTQRSYCNALGYFGVDDIGAISDVAELGGHPWEVPERYLALSPLLHAGNVTTPTLVEHQAEDYRCPLSQAEQWYAALKKRGVPTKLLIYPNESHGMSRTGKPRHRIERLTHNTAWFDQWLGVSPPQPPNAGGSNADGA
jgi:dipeptidyl aminopeptidase/acylaminoacyl peptidase